MTLIASREFSELQPFRAQVVSTDPGPGLKNNRLLARRRMIVIPTVDNTSVVPSYFFHGTYFTACGAQPPGRSITYLGRISRSPASDEVLELRP